VGLYIETQMFPELKILFFDINIWCISLIYFSILSLFQKCKGEGIFLTVPFPPAGAHGTGKHVTRKEKH
jgi:hypothetical protein